MGKHGGSVEQEEPQVSPDRNVSRLTWRRIMQQIAKETLRFSSNRFQRVVNVMVQPLPPLHHLEPIREQVGFSD